MSRIGADGGETPISEHPAARLLSTTHHTWLVGPWATEGVIVVQFDDPDSPVMMLRDRTEVDRLVAALRRALPAAESEQHQADDGAAELFGALRYLIRRHDLLHRHGYYDAGAAAWGDDDQADRILVAAAQGLGIVEVPSR